MKTLIGPPRTYCRCRQPREGLAADRTKWRSALKQHLKTGEEKPMAAAADKRARRKEGSSSIQPVTTHRCYVYNKDVDVPRDVRRDPSSTDESR